MELKPQDLEYIKTIATHRKATAVRLLVGRRDASLLHASDNRLNGEQQQYWRGMAEACNTQLSLLQA